MRTYVAVLRRYADFSGRATRSEYWLFRLVDTAILLLLLLLGVMLLSEWGGVLALLYVLVTFVPQLAVTVRRLHDVGHSAWALVWALIPLALLCFVLQESDGPNKWGGMEHVEIAGAGVTRK